MLCAYSFLPSQYIKAKNRASSRHLAKIRASQVHIFFTKKSKTVYLQGFWPKSVYLKCFGNQLKTVYLQGPCSSRPCISRPCCISFQINLDSTIVRKSFQIFQTWKAVSKKIVWVGKTKSLGPWSSVRIIPVIFYNQRNN